MKAKLAFEGDTPSCWFYQNQFSIPNGIPIIKIWLPKDGGPKPEYLTVDIKRYTAAMKKIADKEDE